MTQPKYPDDLSIIVQSDNQSCVEDKEREGWIMSTSKSFCGATAALMSADGAFGENKMEATLAEVLNEARKSATNRYYAIEEDPNETIGNLATAKKEYSNRIDKIGKYEDMIAAKGCSDVTMSELLSHRSGLVQGSFITPKAEFEGDNLGLYNDDEKFPYDRANKGKVFSYNNTGYMLAEDLMGLAGETGSYELELKKRITDPLDMTHTKPIYESKQAQKDISEIIYVKDVVAEDWGYKSEEDFQQNPMQFTQVGRIPASAGGLCSSISDLEKYSQALSEMVCGRPNALTGDDPQKAQEVHESYLNAYHLGDECTIPGQPSPDMKYSTNHYSLGIFVGAADEQGNQVPSRENKDNRLFLKHDGNFLCYDAKMRIVMEDVTFNDFESGSAAQSSNFTPSTDLLIEQSDMLMRHSLQTIVSHDYAKQMDEYFSSKADADDSHLNYDMRKYWQHIAVVKNQPVSSAWQEDLIEKEKLPSDFAKYHDEVIEAYQPVKQAFKEYIIEKGYIKDDGVIDSVVMKSHFKTVTQFQEVENAMDPYLQVARAQSQEIFGGY